MPLTYSLLRLLALLLCVTAVAFSPAQPNPTNVQASGQRDAQLESQAENGDAAAQFSLGYRYDQAGDYDQALKWYHKGAEQGYALAQSALGSMYQMGRGVAQNFGEALKWYLLALKQDDPVAESNLGLMSARGQGTKPDLGQAMKLFERSAEKGWPPAQANLAYLYTADPSKDLVRAYMWCTLALAGGQEGCKKTLQDIFGQMSGADIDKASSKGFQWFESRAAGPGVTGQPTLRLADVDFAVRVGTLYAQGDVVRQDNPQAVKWFRLGAEQGSALAKSRLGEMYYLGRGVPKDYGQAFTWFQQSAQNGDVFGERDLGFAYLQGVGVAKDEPKAVEWLRKAADRGDPDGQSLLALCYASGTGVPRDEAQAVQLYEKAVLKGNVLALNNSAWLYATSQDTTVRNPAKALEYASSAVKLSHETNPNILDTLAEAYYAQGHYDEAIHAEEKALTLEPHEPSFKERLAKYQQAKSAFGK
jgi:TPR repeat protein